jgi:hypothetical protein
MRLYELYKKTSLAQEEPHAATLTPSPSETAFPGRVKKCGHMPHLWAAGGACREPTTTTTRVRKKCPCHPLLPSPFPFPLPPLSSQTPDPRLRAAAIETLLNL